MKARIRRAIQILRGQVCPVRRSVSLAKRFYGGEDCGFFVCPLPLNEAAVVYSLGIGEDISFDLAVIANHGCRVHGFDPTPKSAAWIKRQAGIPEAFSFFEYGLAEKTGRADLFLPKDARHVSGSLLVQDWVDEGRTAPVEMKSWADIVAALNPAKIDVLKMDIEGAEYLVLDDILNGPVSIDQILIEFHDRLFRDGKARTRDALRKMRERGYRVFGVSASGEEVSFISAEALSRLRRKI
jgi:FkbM family methyltransferase